MKVSELIRELDAFQKLHGDLDLAIDNEDTVDVAEFEVEYVEDLEDNAACLLNGWHGINSQNTIHDHPEVEHA